MNPPNIFGKFVPVRNRSGVLDLIERSPLNDRFSHLLHQSYPDDLDNMDVDEYDTKVICPCIRNCGATIDHELLQSGVSGSETLFDQAARLCVRVFPGVTLKEHLPSLIVAKLQKNKFNYRLRFLCEKFVSYHECYCHYSCICKFAA